MRIIFNYQNKFV